MKRVNNFSLSVSAATFPKPMEVIHVMVKYNAVRYMLLIGGPPSIRGSRELGIVVALSYTKSLPRPSSDDTRI